MSRQVAVAIGDENFEFIAIHVVEVNSIGSNNYHRAILLASVEDCCKRPLVYVKHFSDNDAARVGTVAVHPLFNNLVDSCFSCEKQHTNLEHVVVNT